MAKPTQNTSLDDSTSQSQDVNAVQTDGQSSGNDDRYDATVLRNVKELQIGAGSTVIRLDKSGLWAGAAKFVNAIWSLTPSGIMKSRGANQPTIYTGYVVSNAASTPFPAGWSVAHTGTGVYTVTHTMATANYVVNVNIVNAAAKYAVVASPGSSTFQILTFSTTPAAADLDFMFTVHRTN